MGDTQVLETVEPIAALMEVRDLLEDGNVGGARALLRKLQEEWPESDQVQRLVEVISPTRRVSVPPGQRGRSLDQEREWLSTHASEHPGRWIALKNDRLIAADPALDAVLAAVRSSTEDADAVIHYQEEPERPC